MHDFFFDNSESANNSANLKSQNCIAINQKLCISYRNLVVLYKLIVVLKAIIVTTAANYFKSSFSSDLATHSTIEINDFYAKMLP